jgi:DoxX-like family
MVLAAFATSPTVFSGPFRNKDDLRSLAFSQPTVREARYLTAAYFLMVGRFKWITKGECSFFQSSGYSKAFYIFICLFECICALGLLLRSMILPTLLALAVEMTGAAYTHFQSYFTKGTPDPFPNSLDFGLSRSCSHTRAGGRASVMT